jgi:hypothetical protein
MQCFCCKLFLKWRLSCQQTRNLADVFEPWLSRLQFDGCCWGEQGKFNATFQSFLFLYLQYVAFLKRWSSLGSFCIWTSSSFYRKQFSRFMLHIHISIGSLDICKNGLTKVRTTRIWPCSRRLLSFAGNSALLIHLHQSLHLHQPHEHLEPVCRY